MGPRPEWDTDQKQEATLEAEASPPGDGPPAAEANKELRQLADTPKQDDENGKGSMTPMQVDTPEIDQKTYTDEDVARAFSSIGGKRPLLTHFFKTSLVFTLWFTCTRSVYTIAIFLTYDNRNSLVWSHMPELFIPWGIAIGWACHGFMVTPIKAGLIIPLGFACACVNSFTETLNVLDMKELAAEFDGLMAAFYGVVILIALGIYTCKSKRKRVCAVAFVPIVLTVAISLVADNYVGIYNALPPMMRPFLLSALTTCYTVFSTRLIMLAHDCLWVPGGSYLVLWALAALVHVYPQYIRLAGVCMAVKLNPDPGTALLEIVQTLVICGCCDFDNRNHFILSSLNKLGFPWMPCHLFLDMRRQLSLGLSYMIFVPLVPTFVVTIWSIIFGRPKEGTDLLERWDFWVAMILNVMFLMLTDAATVWGQRNPGETMRDSLMRIHTGGGHKPFWDAPNRKGRPHTRYPTASSPAGKVILGIGDNKEENMDFMIFGKNIPECIMFALFVCAMLTEGWSAGWLYMVNQGHDRGHPYTEYKG